MSSFFPKALTQRAEALDSTHPFYTTKQQALQDFKKKGLPTLKEEAYRHSPIASLFTECLTVEPIRPTETTPETIDPVYYHDMDAYHVVLLNGRVSNEHTQWEGCEQFIQILTFKEAYQQKNHAFLTHFAQHAQSKADAFIALNTALFEEGLFIQIAENAILDKPLVLYHCTASGIQQPVACPRLLVFAGKYSQASIIISWQTIGFSNAVAEVIVQKNARIDYYTLQTHLDPESCQVNTIQCYQAHHSILNTYTFTWSGKMVRNNLSSMIDASHSETTMYGLYYLRGRQHVDNCTTVDHTRPHTCSNELYKGIMTEESTGVFNGRIYVRPKAQKTNALQTNNNLVLSSHATLHTKPQLEIWADDVRCSHGATTGQLDEEQLFYLRARGLQEETARHLLQQAFASEVINKVPLVALRTRLCNSLVNQVI